MSTVALSPTAAPSPVAEAGPAAPAPTPRSVRRPGRGRARAPVPPPPEIAALRGDIVYLLGQIEAVARHHPESSFAIRNRTRQSITRQVHYVNDERRLTKMKEDAGKLLSLWLNLEA